MTDAHLKNGRQVRVESINGTAYPIFAKQLTDSPPDVLILESQANIPDDAAFRKQLVEHKSVCGNHPAFIPATVSGENREGAEVYLLFLASHCGEMPTAQPPVSAPVQPVAQTDQQPQEDPNRPPCLSSQCKKIEAFLKSHYCGESPFGNGPDDGCDIRVEKKQMPGTKVTVDYICKWNEADGKRQCHEQGTTSARDSDILLSEMRRIGLPVQGEKEVHFRVLESSSGWSVMAADYEHASGMDLSLCEVVLAVDPSGQVQVLRKIKLKKTNVDVPDVTFWSPIGIADVDGDGKLEVVLEADAYENHWFEVVGLEDSLFKTVFSGLGYYL